MRKHQYRGQPIKVTDFSEDFEIARYEETLDGLKASGKYDGSFAYGSLIYDDEQPYIVGNIEEVTEDYVALRYWVPVIPETVGEFTCLSDKNGKEIYEGDILGYKITSKRKDTGQILVSQENGIVRFGEYDAEDDCEDRSSYGWLYRDTPLTRFEINREYRNPYWDLVDGGWNLEIIGNIHDNPELLK